MFHIHSIADKFNYSDGEALRQALSLDFPEADLSEEGIEYLRNREVPVRQTAKAAAYDLSLPYDVDIAPGEIKKLLFGWYVDITDNDGDSSYSHKAFVSARSSLCKKKGLVMLYKFEQFHDSQKIIVEIQNITDSTVHIEREERIVQLFFAKNNLEGEVFNTEDIQVVSFLEKELAESFNIAKRNLFEYTFQTPKDVILPPGKVVYAMTGLKWRLNDNHVLIINADDSLSSCVVLANGIGVIDADYYNNPDNEGEIGFPLINMGSLPITLPAGTPLGTGIVCEYGVTSEDKASGKRTGGFGSTDKGGK